MEYRQHTMRYYTALHFFVIVPILGDYTIEKGGHRFGKASVLLRKVVLIECRKYRGHDQDEAGHDKKETQRVPNHLDKGQQQLRDLSYYQKVGEEPQPRDREHEKHKVIYQIFSFRLQESLRVYFLDDNDGNYVEGGTQCIEDGPLVYAYVQVRPNIENDFEDMLKYQG